MRKNVGTGDRVTRGLGALGLLTCAFMAPLAVEVRAPVFGLLGAYLLYTAVAGSCLGYRLMGRSTCPAESP
jgi:hypothetical protein